MQPQEEKNLQVTLQPGEYKVYCPVGSHEVKGMKMTVTPRRAAGGEQGSDRGLGLGVSRPRRACADCRRGPAPRVVDIPQFIIYAHLGFYKFIAKGGERVKKFAIRQVETVKTTAAFYDCKICLPFCEFWLPN